MATKSDLPRYDEYFPPTVDALKRRGGSSTIEELEVDVSRLMGLPEDVLAVPHKNGPRSQFEYELAWVRTYERGVWSLTELGERATVTELRSLPKTVRWAERKAKNDNRQAEPEGIEAEPEIVDAEPDWQERTLAELGKISGVQWSGGRTRASSLPLAHLQPMPSAKPHETAHRQ